MTALRAAIKRLTLITILAGVLPVYGSECMNMHVIDNAPMGYIDANGQPTGVHWEYLAAIENKSGICINKKLLPYSRLWASLAAGTHDGGIIFRSPDRDYLIEAVALIRTLQTVVIPRKGITINSYEDLTGLIIGKTRGTQLSDRFDADDTLKKYRLNHYQQAAKMIRAGRLDAVAGSDAVLHYQLAKYGAIQYVDLQGSFNLGYREQWLQLSKKSKHLDKVEALKKAITALRTEGVLNAIIDKYYGLSFKESVYLKSET